MHRWGSASHPHQPTGLIPLKVRAHRPVHDDVHLVHLSTPLRRAPDKHDHVNRPQNLLTQHLEGQRGAAAQRRACQSIDGVQPRTRTVDRRKRAGMAAGHRLNQVEGFLCAHFAHQDSVWPHPERLHRWLDALVPAARAANVNMVGGPALGAVQLAWALADRLGEGVAALYAEKTDDGQMAVRRGFGALAPGRLFLVEDAMTTGGSLKKAEAAFAAAGIQVVGVGVLVDRRADGASYPHPVTSVVRLPLESWVPDECPLCRAGTPLVHPKQLA
jgi:orotate phosphoribosyltransferase